MADNALTSTAPTYLLVHGAWHGAWCWHKVVPLLAAAGHSVVTFDLPSHGQDPTPAATVTLADYVYKVVAKALRQPGSVILVGHSLAGIVNAQAAEYLGPEKVAGLVVIDGFMPRNGEWARLLAAQAILANVKAGLVPYQPALMNSLCFSADCITALPRADLVDQLFYHDCSAADSAWAREQLTWQAMSCYDASVCVTDARYGIIPKLLIICTKSRDLDKRSLAHHVPCRVIKLASGHAPFLSMPTQLAAAIQRYAV